MAATEREAPAEGGHLIKRPRLTRILDESNARIILLVAPAGYGKTTLAREWLEGKPHVWYRASSADADVAALAVGLASAAAELVPGVDRRIRQRVRAARDPEREASALAELVAEDVGELPDDAWIAIDDYQFIAQTSPPTSSVAALLDATSWRFLATSRVRPSWARARRVVYGGVVILGRDELEMTDAEVSKTVGHTRAQVPTLFENAMGWPAIVGLAARVGPARLEGHTLPATFMISLPRSSGTSSTKKHAGSWPRSRSPHHRESHSRVAPWRTATDLLETTIGRMADARSRATSSSTRFSRDSCDNVRDVSGGHSPDAIHRAHPRPHGGRSNGIRRWDLHWMPIRSRVTHVLEQSLERLLSTGRLPTIERWLDLAEAIDTSSPPCYDLAAAEVSFRRGDYAPRRSSGTGRRFRIRFSGLSRRSLNTAGHSARRLDDLGSALDLYGEARNLAADETSLREAVIGEILTSLELGSAERATLLAHLPADDGFGVNRLRRVTVEGQIALWLGGLDAAITTTTWSPLLVGQVEDPLARTAFLHTRAYLLAGAAHYRAALETCAALEGEAREYRIDFAVLEFWLPRATAEAGLRNFSFARRLAQENLPSGIRIATIHPRECRGLAARIEVRPPRGSSRLFDLGSTTILRRNLRRICPVAGTGRGCLRAPRTSSRVEGRQLHTSAT